MVVRERVVGRGVTCAQAQEPAQAWVQNASNDWTGRSLAFAVSWPIIIDG
jgi:hypothetical protein